MTNFRMPNDEGMLIDLQSLCAFGIRCSAWALSVSAVQTAATAISALRRGQIAD